jgi:hypothetical protein
MKIKFLYLTEKEVNQGIQMTIKYYIEIDEKNHQIWWIEYPQVPEGMHFKKADEYGWGIEYYKKKQSFQDFIESPSYEISKEIHKDLIELFS